MPTGVDGDKGFLDQVLGIGGALGEARELALEIGAQMAAQRIQECRMRRRIAIQASEHESPKGRLVRP